MIHAVLSCRATSNHKVKETVALELSYVNSNLQLLKEELEELNSSVDVYQNDRYTGQPSQAGSCLQCGKSSLLSWDFIFIIISLFAFSGSKAASRLVPVPLPPCSAQGLTLWQGPRGGGWRIEEDLGMGEICWKHFFILGTSVFHL